MNTTRPAWMKDRKVQMAAVAVASALAGMVGYATLTPEPVVAAALPVEFQMDRGESPAKYVGNQTAIAIGEHCGLPIYLGTDQTSDKLISPEQARAFLETDPRFTDKVQITVGVRPGDQFKITGADISCPSRVQYN